MRPRTRQWTAPPARGLAGVLPSPHTGCSNNSWVALRDRGRVIQDTWALDDEGGEEGVPYYECSKRVRSECCVPIRATDGTVIGIIDAEAWRPNHFTPVRVAEVMQVCDDLGQAGLLLGMLGAE